MPVLVSSFYFSTTVVSGSESYCGRLHIIVHNHFMESQTSTELALNLNFRVFGSALTLITGIVFCILGYNTKLNLGSVTQTIIRLARGSSILFLFQGVHFFLIFKVKGSSFFDGRQSFGYSVVLLLVSYLQKNKV